jgi:anthranilate phosphoribosyltransferase
MIDLMANSVKAMDLERAVLAHSQDGLDEISPCANTDIVVVTEGKLTRFSVRPEDFGSARLVFDEIKAGQSLEDAKSMFMAAISDPASSYATAVIPSAAVAIWLADLAPSFEAAAELARTAIASGAAAAKLALLIQKGGLN